MVYLLRCRDRSLYCGYTHDLPSRLRLHREGKASKYTRSRLPVRIVFHESFSSQREAMRREAEIKCWSKSKKEACVRSYSRVKSDGE